MFRLKQLAAYVQLNMPGSDLECRAHLPWTLLEDPDARRPSPKLRKPRVGACGCLVKGRSWPHTEEPQRLVWG